jgi:predicted Zn finger-like uncharacterized protein
MAALSSPRDDPDAREAIVTVQCPYCATDYLLPHSLLGKRGAKVCCPSCRQNFNVLRVPGTDEVRVESPSNGGSAATIPTPGPPLVPGASPPSGQGPAMSPEGAAALAARFLDDFTNRSGARLPAAVARGRFLSELGPDLLRAYDEFRRTLAPGADATVFRAAVKERWGLDLEPGPDAGR